MTAGGRLEGLDMVQARRFRTAGRPRLLGATAIAAAVLLAACGGGASPAATLPASVAPSPSAQASTAPSVEPSVAPTIAPSVAPSGSTADAAAGVKIAAPYSLTALPVQLQMALEQQMAASLGGFGGVTFGFRQIGGASGQGILMVIGFPAGSLNAAAYQGALAGMGSSMGTTFTTTTVDGIEVSTGTTASGAVGVFHVGDHLLVIIAENAADTKPIAEALIQANN